MLLKEKFIFWYLIFLKYLVNKCVVFNFIKNWKRLVNNRVSLKNWGYLDRYSFCSSIFKRNVLIENVKKIIGIVVNVYNYMVERI